MPFNLLNFQFNRGTGTASANGGGITSVTHTYKSTDTLEVIDEAGYFPPNIDGSTDKVFIEDFLLIEASDDTALVPITSTTPFTYGANVWTGSGTNLTVGATIPGASGEGATITSNVLHLEIADTTYPGLLSPSAQVIGGVKTFAAAPQSPLGIQITPGFTLNYYKTANFTTTFTGGTLTTAAAPFSIVRSGSMVCITLNQSIVLAPGNLAVGSFVSNLPLPVEFRPNAPTVLVTGYWHTVLGSSDITPEYIGHSGFIQIDTSGVITFYADADYRVNFPTAYESQIDSGTITYCLN